MTDHNEALSLALSDVDWSVDSPTQPVIHKAHNRLQRALTAAQPAQAGCNHVLYETADADRPKEICDQNGEVVLAMCKLCRKAESELEATQPAAQATPEPVTRSRQCTDPMCACMGGPCAECPEGEREKEIADLLTSLDFYKRRADALQQAQSRMRDPERTMVCDILANGALLVPAGDRYAATPTQQAAGEPVGEPFVATYSSESIGGKQHDTGRVNKGPRGGFFASTASHEDARLIAAALNAYTRPAAAPDTVPLDALHAVERERDYWKSRSKAMGDHAEGTCWYWMGDGEDHLESLVNSLPVVIRADQLRDLLARPAPGVPDVDTLAQFIRQIDGNHSMGAGALAERICEWLAAAQAKGGEHE